MSDDAQLIDQALQGQSEAFGQLVLKYQDRLFNTVFHVVGHAEDARDIVQEALVQAFLKLESFRRESAFYTWLYRIAFNVAMSQRRRRRPTVSMDRLRETTHMEPLDEEDDPAESLERKERCGQVRRAIGQLSRRISGRAGAAGNRRLLLRNHRRGARSARRHRPQPAASGKAAIEEINLKPLGGFAELLIADR